MTRRIAFHNTHLDQTLLTSGVHETHTPPSRPLPLLSALHQSRACPTPTSPPRSRRWRSGCALWSLGPCCGRSWRRRGKGCSADTLRPSSLPSDGSCSESQPALWICDAGNPILSFFLPLSFSLSLSSPTPSPHFSTSGGSRAASRVGEGEAEAPPL